MLTLDDLPEQAHLARDIEAGRYKLVWPLGSKLTFYSVSREDGTGPFVPFVREHSYAMLAATKLQRKHGGTWVVRYQHWSPDADECETGLSAGRVGPR